jgi:hypothetical protein
MGADVGHALYQTGNEARKPRCFAHRAETHEALLAAIAKARGWIDEIRLGRSGSFVEIAKREALGERHVRLLAPLAFLSPPSLRRLSMGPRLRTFTALPLGGDNGFDRSICRPPRLEDGSTKSGSAALALSPRSPSVRRRANGTSACSPLLPFRRLASLRRLSTHRTGGPHDHWPRQGPVLFLGRAGAKGRIVT